MERVDAFEQAPATIHHTRNQKKETRGRANRRLGQKQGKSSNKREIPSLTPSVSQAKQNLIANHLTFIYQSTKTSRKCLSSVEIIT